MAIVLKPENVAKLVFFVRGEKVMLDVDLAKLYGVTTKALNQAMRRNKTRFPEDFAFRLSREEFDSMRSQIVTTSRDAAGWTAPARERFRSWSHGEATERLGIASQFNELHLPFASSVPRCVSKHVRYSLTPMSLTEIKDAVNKLSASELAELAAFIRQQDNAAWDREIDADFAEDGRLRAVADEVRADIGKGRLEELP
jgi:ORF6N domain